MKINFPWKIYPVNFCNIFSEYTHYEIYRSNTIALKEYFENNINDCSCVYLAIGDAMEEQKNTEIFSKCKQWRQLFPFYVEETSKMFKTEIIIITPNINCNPTFISKTQEDFNWQITDSNHIRYISNTYNVAANIFITSFPTIDINNERIINKLNRKIISHESLKKHITNLVQTQDDINFLTSFNDVLSAWVNGIKENGIILCNYFAVFNAESIYSQFNDFYFAPKLKTLLSNTKNNNYINTLLLSWNYVTSETNTILTIPFSEYSFNYVDILSSKYTFRIIKSKKKLKIIILDTGNCQYDTIQSLIKKY